MTTRIRRTPANVLNAVGWLCLGCLALLLGVTGCPENQVDADVEEPDITAPLAPFDFTAEASTLGIKLTWRAPTEDDGEGNDDLQGILLVRATTDYPEAFPERGVDYAVGAALGGGEIVAILSPETEEFADNAVELGRTYFYEAVAFDEVPNYSESSRLASTPGSLVWARLSHAQTDLADGSVLLTGGIGAAAPLDRAEIFEPATSGFRPVVAEMTVARFGHTATLLASGRVLLAGGYEAGFAATLASAELFDPETESFERVDAEMDLGRALHTATLLPDGRVLLAGGTDGINALDTLEIFDPASGQFTLLERALPNPRYGHQALLVEDQVIFFGGFDGFTTLPSAVAFRLSDERVVNLNGAPDEETPMQAGRFNATLTALPDDTWLIAGGFSGALESGVETASAEIFSPAGGPFFATTGSLADARSGHRAVALPGGTVLVCGGIAPGQVILDSAELYDPVEAAFATISPMNSPRTVPEMTRLADGRALITGGNRSLELFAPDPVSTAEIFDPDTMAFTVVGATAP
jgi:hypothetical protein